MTTNNQSYNRIRKFIAENPNLSAKRKRMLIHYATQLYTHNIENVETVNSEDILNDLRILNEYLSQSENTTIVARRLQEELEIFTMLQEHYKKGTDNLDEISEALDKLFLETDLGIREKSNLSYSLIKEKDRKGTRNR